MQIERIIPQRVIAKALTFDESYQIAERIGANVEPDRTLAMAMLQQRLLKIGIYDSSWLLSSPAIFGALKVPILGHLVRDIDGWDRDERKRLEELKVRTRQVLTDYYASPESRRRARRLELAINDLVARGTVSSRDRIQTTFSPTEELLDRWERRWKSD